MWAAGRVLDGFIARRNGTNKLQAFARGVAHLHGNSDVSYGDVDRCAPTQGGKCANHDIGGNQRRAQMINRRVIPRVLHPYHVQAGSRSDKRAATTHCHRQMD